MDNKDGVLAIIRNNQEAGLAVTLLSKHRNSSEHSSGPKDSIAGHNSKTTTRKVNVGSSVGGSNDSPTSTNSEVTNDRYKDSFQVNHCKVKPSSPSYSLEIPTQRPEITGSPLRARTSRHTELFANSLRKYPIATDTRSAELIQKLLDRTQAKHTRRRTEKRKSDGKRGSVCKNNPSKSVQTAHKTATEVSDANVNKLEIRLNINRNLGSRHSMSPLVNESSGLRRDDPSEMYDYLNASPFPTKSGRSSERDVLYLTNFLRDTLRQIVDDGSQECPNISSRFRNHQLSHHPELNRCETTCPRSTNARSQEALPTTSRIHSSESPWGICSYSTNPVHQCSCRELHLCNAINISKTNEPEPECHCRSQELNTKTSFEYYLRSVIKTKPCFCSKSKYERNIDLQLTAWLHELPIFVNECPKARKKREDIIKSLADKLKNNKINDDNIDAVKDEIQTAVKALPIWCPEGEDESEAFRNKLSENLLCRLKEISKPTAEFEQLIINWLNRLPLKSVDSAGRPINIAGLRENIINELKEVIKNRPENNNQYRRRIKDKIMQIQQELPLQSALNLDNLEQLSNKLADELISIPAAIFSEKRINVGFEKEFQKLVSDWIFNIPEISSDDSNDILEVDNMVKKLSKKVNTIPLQKGNEDYIQTEIRKELKDLLNQLNVMKGNVMSSKNVDEYVNDIVNQLCDVTKSLRGHDDNKSESYEPSSDSQTQNVESLILEWLDNIPELAGSVPKEDITGLSRTLQALLSKSGDDENVKLNLKNVTKNWLEIFSKKAGINLDPKINEKLANDLIYKKLPKQRKRWRDNDNGKTIHDMLSDLPQIDKNLSNDEEYSIGSEDKIRQVTSSRRQVTEHQRDKNMSRLQEKYIESFQRQGPDKTIVNKGESSTNINEGTNFLKDNEKKRKIISRRQVPDHNVISSGEDSDNVNGDNTDMNIRKEQNKYSSRRQRPDQKRIIIRENSPPSQVAGIKNSEFNTENLSSIKKDPQDLLRSRTKSVFQDGANKIVSNFLDEIMGKKFTEKKKEVIQELLPKLEGIMYDPLINPTQKEDLMNKEIKNTLQKLPIAKSLQNNYAETLMDRLKNVFKTSTPRGSMMSFHSERDEKELLPLFVDISNPSSDYNVSPASPEEVMYMNKLNDSIESWIDKLHLDFEDDRKFKRAFIKDLTSDIIDRQKYLQLNPNTLSDAEELEHLKYQMFRWLNKKFSEDVVENVMSQIKNLRDTLKNISVPVLIKPKKQHGTTSPMRTDSRTLKEISTFISGLPPNALASNDQRYNEQIVKDLFNKLQLNNCDVDTEIADCLRKLFKSTNKYDIGNHTQQLKNILINEGILKDEQLTQSILMEDISEFIEENISGAIMDWLKNLSAYQRRNSSEKREMGDLVNNLAKSLKNILRQNESYSESKLDEILIKEAMNHLNKFPLYESQKSEDDIRALAKNLIDQLKVTQSLSKRKMSGKSMQKDSESMAFGLNAFYKNIQQWCDEVPFKLGKSLAETEDIKPIKRNITNRLINKIGELNMNPDIFNDDMLYEDLLREEIDDMFLNLPVDESNLPTLKEKLITVVKEAKKKIQDELTARDYKERLRDTVSNYLPTPHLLSTDKEASFEILKENLTDAFVNLHFTTDNENLKNKYRRRIHDELTRFCDSYLKRCPATPLDTVKLSQGLYDALMKIQVPSDDAIKNQIEQTRIKNEIIDWFERLPLRTLAGAEELQRSKFITLLAKYLHEAEMAREEFVESDYTAAMKKEIVKFLKKYIRPDIDNVEEFATRLMDSLKNTEDIRKFKPTRVDGTEISCPYQRYLSQEVICGGGCDPSTRVIQGKLSDEDRDYLRRIRDRAACDKPLPCARSSSCREAMSGSSPVNAGSQTEVCPSYNNCLSFTKDKSGRQPKKQVSSSTETNFCPPCRSSVRPQEIIPKVNINEYAWESTDLSNSLCPNETNVYCPQQSTIPSPLYNNTPVFRHPQTKSRKRLSFSCPNATFEIPRKAQNSNFLQPNYGATEMQSSVIGSDDGSRSRSHPTTPCPRLRNQNRNSSKEFLISMNNDDDEPCPAYLPDGYGQGSDKELEECCKCRGYIMTKCDGMRPNSSCFQHCTSYKKSFRHPNIHPTAKCRRGLCSHKNNFFLR